MKICELLTGPEKWSQNIVAVNAEGKSVGYRNPSACRWCLLGAIYCCYSIPEGRAIESRIKDRLFGGRKRKLGDCLSVWNDAPDRTYRDIKKLITELDI